MINKMLKLAGVKDEKSFYKKYPSEEAFMQQHGEAFNKLVNGESLKQQAEQSGLVMDYGASGIHINPANKGKFTATKKATGKSTEELTHSKNPLTRKRAVFAQNAAKWNHGEDGIKIGQLIPKQPVEEVPDFAQYQPFTDNGADKQGIAGTPQFNPAGNLMGDTSGVQSLNTGKSKKKTDIGKTVAGGLLAIDMMMPPEQIKMNYPSPANNPYYNPYPSGTGSSALMEDGGQISTEKARQILHDGTIRGKKITNKQRKYFGAMSNMADGGDIDPFTIKDTRTIDKATGLPVTDKNKLTATTDTDLVKAIVKSAKKAGIDPSEALAMAFQETSLKMPKPNKYLPNPIKASNPFMVGAKDEFPGGMGIGEWQDKTGGDSIDTFMALYKNKLAHAKKSSDAARIQSWNGYGNVQDLYGLKGNINMAENPIYGKRIMDIRENIIAKDPTIQKILNEKLAMGGGLPGASGMFYQRGGGDWQPKSMRMGGHFTTAYADGGDIGKKPRYAAIQVGDPNAMQATYTVDLNSGTKVKRGDGKGTTTLYNSVDANGNRQMLSEEQVAPYLNSKNNYGITNYNTKGKPAGTDSLYLAPGASPSSIHMFEQGGSVYEQGGELQLYSPDSQAAQLSPSIIKFQGKEHGESNAIGSEGIPLQYGGNPVEVENDETGYSTQDGGFTVLGKMKNPLSGRMFKNDGKVLAAKEAKASKQLVKGTNLMDSADTQNPFELLKFNSGKAKTIGAKAKAEQVNQEKETLAALQQHMLDFAEQNNLDPNAMSKGKIKKGKYGIDIPKAFNGINEDNFNGPIDYSRVGKSAVKNVMKGALKSNYYEPKGEVPYRRGSEPTISIKPQYNTAHNLPSIPTSLPIQTNTAVDNTQPDAVTFGDMPPIAPIKNDLMFKGADWKNYIKPGYVLATNKKQAVRMATLPTPALEQSYQGEVDLNPIVANTRAMQQSLGGNAAEAATATALANQQIYQAQSQGFAANQDRTAGVFARNRQAMNDYAKTQANITQTQADRQAQMEANTRAMTRDALGQFGEIDLQNKRDWNNFNVQKQMFPTYGVDPNYQLNVENPYNFNVPQGYVSDGAGGWLDKNGNKVVVKQKFNNFGVSTGKDVTTTTSPLPHKKNGGSIKGKYGISINREFKSYKP